MAYKGQPVPSTGHNIGYGKISDGKSVKVTATEAVTAGKFYYFDGFLGCAFQDAKANDEVILNIEPAEYETDQIRTSDSTSMVKGTDIFWDKNNKYFTVSGTDVYAGKITAPADANNVIWFKLAERPYSVDSVTTLAAQVGSLSSLTTTAKTSVVAAINEVNGKKAAKVAAIADPSTATAEDVATKLNALLTALTNAGLMAN